MDPESGVARQRVEVGVGVEDGDVGADGDGGDEAVDELSDRLAVAPTGPAQRRSVFVVGEGGGQQRGPGEEPAELIEVLFVSGAGQDLHVDRCAGREVGFKERIDGVACLRTGIAEELDPGGRVDQDRGSDGLLLRRASRRRQECGDGRSHGIGLLEVGEVAAIGEDDEP
jgi:hypothetical protein